MSETPPGAPEQPFCRLDDPAISPASEGGIQAILDSSQTIAVVGLSSRPYRPSYGVAEYLQSAGYRVIPVNPNETEVLGEKAFARLEDSPAKIHLVDIFWPS